MFPTDSGYIDTLISTETNDVLYSKDEGKKYEISEYVAGADTATGRISDISNPNLSQQQPEVKLKLSTRDNEGNTLSEGQQRYFADSKVRDENGNLMVVYHGTNQGDFTEFKWEYTQRADGGFYGRGHYFTTIRSMAAMYGNRVIAGYANIVNPFVWEEEAGTYI